LRLLGYAEHTLRGLPRTSRPILRSYVQAFNKLMSPWQNKTSLILKTFPIQHKLNTISQKTSRERDTIYSRYIIPTLAATLIASVQSLTVDSVIHLGTGCPQDATTFSIIEDGDRYLPQKQIFIHPSQYRSNIQSPCCTHRTIYRPKGKHTIFIGIGVSLASPSEQQFAPVSTTYYDNLNIPAGVTGSHIITYTFS
jgi:hypothetical protein